MPFDLGILSTFSKILDTSRQILDTYSWNFVKLLLICSCKKLWHVLDFSHYFLFRNKSFNCTILTLRLWEKMTWGLTYFDQFICHSVCILKYILVKLYDNYRNFLGVQIFQYFTVIKAGSLLEARFYWSSLIRVYTVWHSVNIFWTHYSVLKRDCSNFRIITSIHSGIQI